MDTSKRSRTKKQLLTIFACGCLLSCGESRESYVEATTPDSVCTGCDHEDLAIPVMTANGGYGAVTTYGSVTNPQPSAGGACNYGTSNVQNFAAAFVNLEPGDGQGFWNQGHACGQCVRVRVGSASGWKSVVVRIMDKCPDAYCGIDLGGAPAATLMGSQPGRYAGEWTLVSCDLTEGVSDGNPTLFVKDGSNQWWSLVQVRNPPGAVLSITWVRPSDGKSDSLRWASEAENFFKVPDSLLASEDSLWWHIHYWTGTQDSIFLPGSAFSVSESSWPLQ